MKDDIDQRAAAAMFKALGDPTRLRIFEFLRACRCPVTVDASGGVMSIAGPTAGEVCCHITGAEKISSTISHHLKELRLAGVISVERRGKHMVCGVNQKAVEALTAYLAGDETGDSGCC